VSSKLGSGTVGAGGQEHREGMLSIFTALCIPRCAATAPGQTKRGAETQGTEGTGQGSRRGGRKHRGTTRAQGRRHPQAQGRRHPQGTGHRAQGTGHWAQGTGHWAQGTGHWAQGTGHWAQAQGTGHWGQAELDTQSPSACISTRHCSVLCFLWPLGTESAASFASCVSTGILHTLCGGGAAVGGLDVCHVVHGEMRSASTV